MKTKKKIKTAWPIKKSRKERKINQDEKTKSIKKKEITWEKIKTKLTKTNQDKKKKDDKQQRN